MSLTREEKIERIEQVDEISVLRNILRKTAPEIGQWAGIPIPVEGDKLCIVDGHPLKEVLEPKLEENSGDSESSFDIVNAWHSRKKDGEVIIYRENGKLGHMVIPSPRVFDFMIRSTGMAPVWGVEQESKAVESLGQMLRYHRFHSYLITGAFLERSERSGIMYMFRRMRPTLAITMNKPRVEVLAALCLHPIGYYENSCAGAMCPTDDVIAHLTMMRGDEHLYWKRATQHPPWLPNAMI